MKVSKIYPIKKKKTDRICIHIKRCVLRNQQVQYQMPVDSESTENPAEWRHQTQADAEVKKWLSEAEPLCDRESQFFL